MHERIKWSSALNDLSSKFGDDRTWGIDSRAKCLRQRILQGCPVDRNITNNIYEQMYFTNKHESAGNVMYEYTNAI